MHLHSLLALASPCLASVVGRTGQQPLGSDAGSASTAFRCDLPPAVSPDGDGLPSADDLFGSPAALAQQVRRHAAVVQVPSISYDDMRNVSDGDARWDVFYDLHAVLAELYPAVHARMELTKVNGLGLVYTLAGSEAGLKPLMLTAHQDVVPVTDAGRWTYPPFAGHYDGRFLWGRGSMDDKNCLTAVMTVMESLLGGAGAARAEGDTHSGWTPRRSIVLAFGFDEESSGRYGAGSIASYLEQRFGRDSMAMILDEGGSGLQPLGDALFALPAVSEKGHVDVLYELRVAGGHSSMPLPHTGIGIMAEIVTALEAHPYEPAVLPGSPIHQSYLCKARYAPEAEPEVTRLVRKGDLAKLAAVLAAQDRATNFRLQTSQAIDLIAGGVKINAMPEVVTLGVNYRVAPHDSIDKVKAKTLDLVRPIAAKYHLDLHAFGADESPSSDQVHARYDVDYNGSLAITTRQETQPAPVSPTTGPIWDVFSGTIQHTFAFGGPVVPAGDIMNGNTDTRHYQNLTSHIYRYIPLFFNSTANIHTVDERIDMDAHMGVVKFYYNLIRNLDASDA